MIKLNLFLFLILFIARVSSAQMSEHDMEIASPGPEHERLKTLEGEWVTDLNYNVPGGQTINGAGSLSNKMILGGRFLQMDGFGEIMGMNVKSLSILGYDRRVNKYTMVSYDELGTYYVTGEGIYDETAKTISLYGTTTDPAINQAMDYRFVFDLSDPNAVNFKVIFKMPEAPGGELAVVEAVYRKK